MFKMFIWGGISLDMRSEKSYGDAHAAISWSVIVAFTDCAHLFLRPIF